MLIYIPYMPLENGNIICQVLAVTPSSVLAVIIESMRNSMVFRLKLLKMLASGVADVVTLLDASMDILVSQSQ